MPMWALYELLDAKTDAVWPRANGAGRPKLAEQLVDFPEEEDLFILPNSGDILCECDMRTLEASADRRTARS